MGHGLTMAAARLAGSPDLKIPEPTTRHPHPTAIIRAASAGWPRHRSEVTTGIRRVLWSLWTARKARDFLGVVHQFLISMLVNGGSRPAGAGMPDRLDTSPVPASPWYGSWRRLPQHGRKASPGYGSRIRTGP